MKIESKFLSFRLSIFLFLLISSLLIITACQKQQGKYNIDDVSYSRVKAIEKEGVLMLSINRSDGVETFTQSFLADSFRLSVKKANGRPIVLIERVLYPEGMSGGGSYSRLNDSYFFHPSKYTCDGTAMEMCDANALRLHIVERDDCSLEIHAGMSGVILDSEGEIVTSHPDDVWYFNCWIDNDPNGVISRN